MIIAGGLGFFIYCYLLQRLKEDEKRFAQDDDDDLKKDPDDLWETIVKSCNNSDNNNSNPVEDKKLLHRIRNMKKHDYRAHTRISATKWLILYHMRYELDPKATKEEIRLFREKLDEDFEQAWQLISTIDEKNLDEEESNNVDMLQLNISQSLPSKLDKLPGIFDRIVARKHLDDDEEESLFTVAPLVGRWTKMKSLGQSMLKKEKFTLIYFNELALNQPDIFDYSVLYDISKNQSDTKMTTLPWIKYNILNIILKFTRVICDDKGEEQRRKISMGRCDNFAEGLQPRTLTIKGAVVKTLSFSPCSLPICGVAITNHLFMKGYGNVRGGGKEVKQSEEYKMSRLNDKNKEGSFEDNEVSRWKGTCTIVTEPPDNCPPDQIFSRLTMCFALQFDLEPISFRK